MEIKSKHRSVARAPYMLYMPFSDMRNFVAMLPEDKKQGVEADYDTIHATVQGFNVGVRYMSVCLIPESLTRMTERRSSLP